MAALMETTPAASDRLVYDPATHTTRTATGIEVPHVTRILSAVGVSTDFEEVAERSWRMRDRLEHLRQRGTAVHADCHAYDDDDLDLDACDVRVRPFVEAWAACRAEKGLVPVTHARERRVFHDLDWYTGIMDGLFRRQGKFGVVDLKTGDPDDAAAHLQTAAYAEAYVREHPDVKIEWRWAVWLRPGRRVPYTIVDYTDARRRPDCYLDYQKFRACLTVFREQPAQRRGR